MDNHLMPCREKKNRCSKSVDRMCAKHGVGIFPVITPPLLDIHDSVHHDIIYENDQQDATV